MARADVTPRLALGREIGERVRALRKAKGYTLRDVAEQVGVTSNAVWNIEMRGSIPDGETMMYLALCFGVSTDELYPEDYRTRFAVEPSEPQGRRASRPASASAQEGGVPSSRRLSVASSDSNAQRRQAAKRKAADQRRRTAKRPGREGGFPTTRPRPAEPLPKVA